MLTLLPKTAHWSSGRPVCKRPVPWRGERSRAQRAQHDQLEIFSISALVPVCALLSLSTGDQHVLCLLLRFLLDLQTALSPWAYPACCMRSTVGPSIQRDTNSHSGVMFCTQLLSTNHYLSKNKQKENTGDTFTWYFSGSWKCEIMNKNVHYRIIHFSPWFTSQ